MLIIILSIRLPVKKPLNHSKETRPSTVILEQTQKPVLTDSLAAESSTDNMLFISVLLQLGMFFICVLLGMLFISVLLELGTYFISVLLAMLFISELLLQLGMLFISVLFQLGMMWLECALKSIDSFLRMDTASFFPVLWCGVFSVIAMVGMFKFFLLLAGAVVVGLSIGFTAAVILMGISGVVLLWLYGSFWTTMAIIFSAGSAFILEHEHLSLFIVTLYSVYSAWVYVGWLGLTFALNLSFISREVLH